MNDALGKQHWLTNEDFETYTYLLQGGHVPEFFR